MVPTDRHAGLRSGAGPDLESSGAHGCLLLLHWADIGVDSGFYQKVRALEAEVYGDLVPRMCPTPRGAHPCGDVSTGTSPTSCVFAAEVSVVHRAITDRHG